MDTVLERPWTPESFLAWEDQQEFKHEFDGREVVAITGGSVAHQRIIGNLWVLLMKLLADRPLTALMEMRLRANNGIRYPDVLIAAGPLDQTVRTLSDAIAIFEVLSDDTATTDRVEKPIDYATLPSLRTYVLVEQTLIAATVLTREPGGPWTANVQKTGNLIMAGLDIEVPLAALYNGLTFPA